MGIIEEKNNKMQEITELKNELNSLNISLKKMAKNIDTFEELKESFRQIYLDDTLSADEQIKKIEELKKEHEKDLSEEDFEEMKMNPATYIDNKMEEMNERVEERNKIEEKTNTLENEVKELELRTIANPKNKDLLTGLVIEQERKKEAASLERKNKLEELNFKLQTKPEEKITIAKDILNLYSKENIKLNDEEKNLMFKPLYLKYHIAKEEYNKCLNSNKNENKQKLPKLIDEIDKTIADLAPFIPDIIETKKEEELEKVHESRYKQQLLINDKMDLETKIEEYNKAKINVALKDKEEKEKEKEKEKNNDKNNEKDKDKENDKEEKDKDKENDKENENEQQFKDDVDKSNEQHENSRKTIILNFDNEEPLSRWQKIKNKIKSTLSLNEEDQYDIDEDIDDFEEERQLPDERRRRFPGFSLFQKIKESFNRRFEKNQDRDDINNVDYEKIVKETTELNEKEANEFFKEHLQKNVDEYIEQKLEDKFDIEDYNRKYNYEIKEDEKDREEEQEIDDDLDR